MGWGVRVKFSWRYVLNVIGGDRELNWVKLSFGGWGGY